MRERLDEMDSTCSCEGSTTYRAFRLSGDKNDPEMNVTVEIPNETVPIVLAGEEVDLMNGRVVLLQDANCRGWVC